MASKMAAQYNFQFIPASEPETKISKGDVIADASPVVMELLLKALSKSDKILQSAVMGNVTNFMTKRLTPLQIA